MSVILKASKRVRTSGVRTAVTVPIGSGSVGYDSLHAEIPYTGTSFARCAYRFDLPEDFLSDVPVVSPFSTLYELMPYSFVLDWFVPIGDWFGALEAAQWSPYFVEGWELYGARETFTSPTFVYGPTDWRELAGHATFNAEAFRYARSVVSSFPSLPGVAINPSLGLSRVSQGLSLLTQVFQRWR